jgi:hypothetical protein
MNLQKIIHFIKSAIGLIVFGYYKTSDIIPFFNKKVTIEDYKLFLKRTTINSWDELLKPSFIDGYVDAPDANIKITSDLNFDTEFPMTLTQNKKEFQFWIAFEEKENVIKIIHIRTGDNFDFVTFDLIISTTFFSICMYFDFHFLVFISFLSLIRLYTIMKINQSITLLKTHLAYMFELYSQSLQSN